LKASCILLFTVHILLPLCSQSSVELQVLQLATFKMPQASIAYSIACVLHRIAIFLSTRLSFLTVFRTMHNDIITSCNCCKTHSIAGFSLVKPLSKCYMSLRFLYCIALIYTQRTVRHSTPNHWEYVSLLTLVERFLPNVMS
jgi:hypothetical protein